MTFDVEEYRADLERRRDVLLRDSLVVRRRYAKEHTEELAVSARRMRHKADGIQIALDLLPKTEPKPLTHVVRRPDGSWGASDGS